MRPRIVLTVIGFAALVVITLALMRSKHDEPDNSVVNANGAAARRVAAIPASTPADGSTNASADKAKPGTAADETVVAERGNQPKPAATSAGATQSQTHEEYVEQRVGELMDLGMSDDPEALKTILSELYNSDGEIRKAAIEATKQFGSTDAIPKLEDAIAGTENSADKQELREAIEFLKLPSFVAKRN